MEVGMKRGRRHSQKGDQFRGRKVLTLSLAGSLDQSPPETWVSVDHLRFRNGRGNTARLGLATLARRAMLAYF